MKLLQNISLKPYNTFGIDVPARYFTAFDSLDTLEEIFEYKENKLTQFNLLTIGGGSNILFTKNFDGIVLKNELSGIEKIKETGSEVFIKAGAGVNWHRFVMHCISNKWAGIENLSLIPGCVGASPMQNIGAYGVEIKDIFHELEALHIKDKSIQKFSLEDCAFGYRESVFKNKYKNQFIILNVTYRLSKQPTYHVNYGAIKEELDKMKVQDLSIEAISQAVINIRSSKLPDPKIIGNAGSFFKNPIISQSKFNELKKLFPDIPGYITDNNNVKLAAGWLIEHCGPSENTSWKGFREGDAGVHAKQALVLVNYGISNGSDIYNLSEKILHSVKNKFNVSLEREVNIM